MLLAVSAGVAGTAVVLFVVFWVLPFVFARRIGRRKGRFWLGYWFLLGWVGVLILALLPPKRWAAAASGFTYHVPPEVARRQARQRRR